VHNIFEDTLIDIFEKIDKNKIKVLPLNKNIFVCGGQVKPIISSDNDHFSFRDIFINKSSLLDKDYGFCRKLSALVQYFQNQL